LTAALVLAGTSFSQAAGRSAQSQAKPAPPANPTDAAVVAASEQWFEAISNADVKALEDMETDDFLSFQLTPQGVTMIPKKAQIEVLQKTPAANRLKWERELGGPRIRSYGNVSILTAVATFRGQDRSGKPVVTQSLLTEVWVNMNGKWRISHFQPFTLPPRAQPAPAAPAPSTPPAK
jgi:ketosteroid isomerase-like protein